MSTTLATDSWVIRPRPNPKGGLRLFCFPYIGGGASIFREWPEGLPPEVELCAIQLPGREIRLKEPPFTRLSPLVQALARALRPYLEVPFAFLGHSMGGLISFELTRQLRRQNHPGPVHLFISGSRAPHIPNPHRPIHHLPESAFVAELRRYGGTPEAVLQHAELLQLFLPLLRADFSVYETYAYTAEQALDCPISVFGGLADRKVSYDDLAAWRDHTQSSFTLRIVPGDHFFLNSARDALLQALSQDMMPFLNRITGD